MSRRIIQISDCHLLADPAGQLKGICTRQRLAAVVAALTAELARADRLIVTGDLTHDERSESYAALKQLLSDWQSKLRVIPGNHDDRALLREAFPDQPSPLDDRIVFAESLGTWRWIGLDTLLTGSVAGELGVRQLDWLRQTLDEQPQQPTLICLHHPPIAVHSAWLDAIDLTDASSLWAVLANRSQVRVMLAGHIHQELSTVHQQVAVFTTPSTGVQFLPEVATLEIDSLAPGYRILELHDDGRIWTRVVRLPGDFRIAADEPTGI